MKSNTLLCLFLFHTVFLHYVLGYDRSVQKSLYSRECCEISLTESGIINQIRIIAVGNYKQIYDALLLEIFWDGSKEASVITPLAPLCGVGFGNSRESKFEFLSCQNLYDETPGILTIRNKMPFRSAYIRITNCGVRSIKTFDISLDITFNPSPPPQRFHTFYLQKCCAKQGSLISLPPIPPEATLQFSIQHFLRGPGAKIDQPYLFVKENDSPTSFPLKPSYIDIESLANRSYIVYQIYDSDKIPHKNFNNLFSHFSNIKGRTDCCDYGIVVGWFNNKTTPVPSFSGIDWIACDIDSYWRIPSTPDLARRLLTHGGSVSPPIWVLPEKIHGCRNIAPQSKAVIASSSNRPYQEGKLAVDGRLDTKWCALINDKVKPTLKIDLGNQIQISGIILYPASAAGEDPGLNVLSYKVEISPDSLSNWTTIVNYNRDDGNVSQKDEILHLFPKSYVARYVRLSIIKSSQQTDIAQVTEIAVLSPFE